MPGRTSPPRDISSTPPPGMNHGMKAKCRGKHTTLEEINKQKDIKQTETNMSEQINKKIGTAMQAAIQGPHHRRQIDQIKSKRPSWQCNLIVQEENNPAQNKIQVINTK